MFIAGLSVLGLSAIVHAPAALLEKAARLPQVASRIEPAGLSLSQARGTLWSGSLLVEQTPFGFVQEKGFRVHWELNPSGLLAGALTLDWQVEQPSLSLQGELAGSLSGRRLHGSAQGSMGMALMQPVLAPHGIRIPGDVLLKSFNLSLYPDGRLEHLSGSLYWDGGGVALPLGQQRFEPVVPALEGQLSLRSGQPSLRITESGKATELLVLTLDLPGAVDISVRQRLPRSLGLPHQSGRPDDDVVVRIRRPLFPGAAR